MGARGRSGADPEIPGGVVPLGARVVLPGRGTTFIRMQDGPPGAPTVLLLHGWLATGALNWYQCFAPLAGQATVITIDHRGHGRGIRSRRRFRLADCADDTAAAVRRLGVGPVIAVGYSMGGPIAQLLWRRHPDLVAGLGFVATGTEFVTGNRHRYAASALLVAATGSRVGAAALAPPAAVVRRLLPERPRERPGELAQWGRQEMALHDPRGLLEAAHAIAHYSARDWIGQVDVPTEVMVTQADSAVSPAAQYRLATAIEGAEVSVFAGGHASCVDPAFGTALAELAMRLAERATAAGGFGHAGHLELTASDQASR